MDKSDVYNRFWLPLLNLIPKFREQAIPPFAKEHVINIYKSSELWSDTPPSYSDLDTWLLSATGNGQYGMVCLYDMFYFHGTPEEERERICQDMAVFLVGFMGYHEYKFTPLRVEDQQVLGMVADDSRLLVLVIPISRTEIVYSTFSAEQVRMAEHVRDLLGGPVSLLITQEFFMFVDEKGIKSDQFSMTIDLRRYLAQYVNKKCTCRLKNH